MNTKLKLAPTKRGSPLAPRRATVTVLTLLVLNLVLPQMGVTALMGQYEYSEYVPGTLPLVLTVPHGGTLNPPSLPLRTGEISVDLKTKEVAQAVVARLETRFGGQRPHLVMMHLARRRVDANRSFAMGTLPNETHPNSPSGSEIAWSDYHGFIATAINTVRSTHGRGLVLDIHGHGHPENHIELGYLITRGDLGKTDQELNANPIYETRASIRGLSVVETGVSFASLLRGATDSLGGLLETSGYPTVPSPSHTAPAPTASYFDGGYTTEQYGSMSDAGPIDAIQAELPQSVRLVTGAAWTAFINSFGDVITSFLQTYYL